MSDQRFFNVVDQRGNNVDPTLKTKENPTSYFQRCTTLIQRQCPTLNNVETTLHNVETTLHNVDTTLIQSFFNLATTESYIESNRAGDDYGFVKRPIVFILLNEKTFFTIY